MFYGWNGRRRPITCDIISVANAHLPAAGFLARTSVCRPLRRFIYMFTFMTINKSHVILTGTFRTHTMCKYISTSLGPLVVIDVIVFNPS